jgi:hypothetical protein
VSCNTPRTLRLAPLAALLLISACSAGDARLKQLSAGISKDSVLAIMGVDKPQRADMYLVAGHHIETMYFSAPGATDSASLTDRNMTPVVVVDGKLTAWGWKQWDSIATETKIQVAPKE